METKLEKEVRYLKIYAAVATLFCGILLLSAFVIQNGKQKFEEIDVERINIVEKDGKLRMVISNRERQHPGMVDGKPIPRENGRPPGMIFFDQKGDEAGGLVFDENGDKGHFLSLTFDKTRNDQTIGLQHLEGDNGEYFAGLRVWDRPDSSIIDSINKYEVIKKMPEGEKKKAALKELEDKGEFGTDRITVGKLRDKSALIELSDTKGNPRIRISVDAMENPKIDFLDEKGKVIYSLPQKNNNDKR